MRTYQIYLIEDEFASHYFGRERMFFQLFQEHHNSIGDLKCLLSRQIDYITKPISTLRLQQVIHQQLNRFKDFRLDRGKYYIEKNGKYSKANLSVYDRILTLEANGSFDAETIFFEVLRKCESSFLAIDLPHQRYGWLKPIKERKFV